METGGSGFDSVELEKVIKDNNKGSTIIKVSAAKFPLEERTKLKTHKHQNKCYVWAMIHSHFLHLSEKETGKTFKP